MGFYTWSEWLAILQCNLHLMPPISKQWILLNGMPSLETTDPGNSPYLVSPVLLRQNQHLICMGTIMTQYMFTSFLQDYSKCPICALKLWTRVLPKINGVLWTRVVQKCEEKEKRSHLLLISELHMKGLNQTHARNLNTFREVPSSLYV